MTTSEGASAPKPANPAHGALPGELPSLSRHLPLTSETRRLLHNLTEPGARQAVWKLLDIVGDASAHRRQDRIAAIEALSLLPLSLEGKVLAAKTLAAIVANELPGDDRDARERACIVWAVVLPFLGVPVVFLLTSMVSLLVAPVLVTPDKSLKEAPPEVFGSIAMAAYVGLLSLPP